MSLVVMLSCKSSHLLDSSETKAKNLKVYLLSSIEVDQESDGISVIAKRKVLKEIALLSKEKEKLLVELINEKNYEPIDRKCEREPVFALKVSSQLMALVDVKYCPYVEFYNPDGTSYKKQLIFDSVLAAILKEE